MSQDEKVDGPKLAADILSRMKPANREKIVESIKSRHPELLAKIEEKLVRFDDIVEASDQGIQLLLQRIAPTDLVLSLKTAGLEVKNALFKNMSDRKRRQVEEEVDRLGPVRVTEVEAAQRRIAVTLDQLRTEGLIRSRVKSEAWA
jgi:flagellar motor switch protein FliG